MVATDRPHCDGTKGASPVNRRGILLAGGTGTRLYPLTVATSKHLQAIYDKPMVYYPLTTLMLAGIAEILVVSTPRDLPALRALLGDGQQWGLELTYAIQERPRGIADALIVADEFLDGHPSALILGDNIFYGHGLAELLRSAGDNNEGATILAYHVQDAQPYGVLEIDDGGRPAQLIEKPERGGSGWAVTGLYFYDAAAPEIARGLKPSSRGEIEITDVNRQYLERGALEVEFLRRGFAWLDAGTPSRMHSASNFVQSIQERQGLLIASPEEVAYRTSLITRNNLLSLADSIPQSEYGAYLRWIAKG